jgi:predicted enzyme related to lactoylglutathione lyase
MNYIKHVGIYVEHLNEMQEFYARVFDMKILVDKERDSGTLYETLYEQKNAGARISKLITEYGAKTGQGDMIEFIQTDYGKAACTVSEKIYMPGTFHIAMGVDDMDEVVDRIREAGGSVCTEIIHKGSRKCCFCRDIEGNWIELLE